MTTYTLTNGLAIYYDPADGEEDTVLGVDNINVTLELVVPATTTSLSYTVNPLEPGDLPGEGNETVDIALDDYTVRIHGMTPEDGTPIDPEVSIFEVNWTDTLGVSQISTVLVAVIDGVPVGGLGLADADYIFVIDGAPLPTFASPADWDAFDDALVSISVPTGTYGPGAAIPLTSLGATVSQDDIITGTSGKDVFKGGAGDDVIHGLGGKDKLFGGNGNDELHGGTGADILNPGSNTYYDTIFTGGGGDTVVFSGATSGYFSLAHGDLTAGITVTIDGIANTGTIQKTGAGTTTIIDVANPMLLDGLGVQGTSFKDIFNITVADGPNGWMQVSGGMGKDSFNIGASTGKLRLDFRDFSGTSTGLDINLGTGRINDDGYGNFEKITGPGQVWEVRGTMEDDKIIGSANDESFILMGGTDIVNGKDGFDRLRYDRSGVDGVTVDLEAGTATGLWNGEAFTHTISGIEHVRGSNGNDLLTAADGQENKLEGRDGNDILEGGFSNDELLGGKGIDKLWGDKGKDLLQGEGGNDKLWGEGGRDRLEGGDGNDKMFGGGGNDRMLGGAGKDTLDGGNGNDKMTGNGGADTFIFGTGADVVTDFSTANALEKVNLSGVASITGADDLAKYNDLLAEHLSEVDGNVVINDLGGNTMTLNGVTIADLGQDDFIF